MAENSKVYTGKLPCGFPYELHQISSFSNRTEIALIANGELVFVVAVDKKRSGVIEFRPGQSQKIIIRSSEKTSESEPSHKVPATPAK